MATVKTLSVVNSSSTVTDQLTTIITRTTVGITFKVTSKPNQRDPVKAREAERLVDITDSSLFSGNNIYLFVFVLIALAITAVVTFIRHRQQKMHAENKELEYLRYFHSILPQSQIYGDLNESLAKFDRKRQWSMKRSNNSQACDNKLDERICCTFPGLCSCFHYRTHVSKTVTFDPDDDNDECLSIEDNDLYQRVLYPIDAGIVDEVSELEPESPPLLSNKNANYHTIQTAKKMCQKFYFKMNDANIETENANSDTLEQKLVDNSHINEDFHQQRNSETIENSNHRVHFNMDKTESIPNDTFKHSKQESDNNEIDMQQNTNTRMHKNEFENSDFSDDIQVTYV